MTLSEMLGFTCTVDTYHIAFAFMGKENIDHYEWVLGQLAELYAKVGKRPETLVTDRDIAEMNAINELFPDAQHLLCWVHIMRNCVSYAMGLGMPEGTSWRFAKKCRDMFSSTTMTEYRDRLDIIKKKCKPALYNYLQKVWLRPYHDRIVRVFNDHRLTLFTRTTNR